jgi:DNA-binding XRE family transcriptional regulator
MVAQYPAIISFLGYLGYESWIMPQTLGEKLLTARRRRGLSAKRAAKLLGVDEEKFASWEREKRKPLRESQLICDRFLSA